MGHFDPLDVGSPGRVCRNTTPDEDGIDTVHSINFVRDCWQGRNTTPDEDGIDTQKSPAGQ